MRKLIILLLSATVFAASAHAAQSGQPLDRATIERWIAAYSELEAWSDTQPHADMGEDTDEEAHDNGTIPDFDEIMRAYQESVANEPGAVRIIERHGFRGAAEWADVSARVTLALMAIGMQDAQPEIEAAMAEAMHEMEQNPDFTEEDRAMLRQQIRQSMAVGARLVEQARDEDLPAVRDMQQELAPIIGFGSTEDYQESD